MLLLVTNKGGGDFFWKAVSYFGEYSARAERDVVYTILETQPFAVR